MKSILCYNDDCYIHTEKVFFKSDKKMNITINIIVWSKYITVLSSIYKCF